MIPKALQRLFTILAVVILSSSTTVFPVSGNGRLGWTQNSELEGYGSNPKVPGVVGYLWPSVSGSVNLRSHFQYTVLAGSTGDLIFGFNYSDPRCTGPSPSNCGPTTASGNYIGWDTLAIYIPANFSVPDSSQIVSTLSNDYSGYVVVKASQVDRYCPGCTVVYVAADQATDATRSGVVPYHPYYNHQFINFTTAKEWYYVRINGVTAPFIAGRYLFKIAVLNTCSYLIAGEEGVSTGQDGICGEPASQFIPTQNWPSLTVAGDVYPATISGTIRYAGYNQSLYGQPVQEAGCVWANMTMRLDPYTGASRADLTDVDAQGYFNSTAQGHYEVEGLASGIYDIYASAAGYPRILIASRVKVLSGQSLHLDGYVQPGLVVHGYVFSKHQFGDEPWAASMYVKIELYGSPTLNHIPDSNANLVSWSPLPCIAGGQNFYIAYDHAGNCGDPRTSARIAFPWHEYAPMNGYGGLQPFYQVSYGTQDGSVMNENFADPQGVGPPQHWFVQGGSTVPFHFEFGVKGEYGAPSELDGMVPQVYATWVNGLAAGRYYVRAWVFRYVQSALDGSTFQEYYFDVTPDEWAGDVTVPIDLRLSSWVNKTVYFHDVANGITSDPIDTGAGLISGVLVDTHGQVWSYNQTLLGYMGRYSFGVESGWGPEAFSSDSTVISELNLDAARLNAHAIETGRANIQFWGWNDTWGGDNYGIPPGTYVPHIYVLGYVEDDPVASASITLSGSPNNISDQMYRGAGFNITVYSTDWERPMIQRNWVWGQVGIPPTSTGAGYTGSGLGTGNRGMVGQEIDLGIYANNSLIDYLGDDVASLADTITTSCLFQNSTTSVVKTCGGGWNVSNDPPADQNSNGAFFGQEMSGGYVGGETDGYALTVTAKSLIAPAHWSATLLPGAKSATYHPAFSGYTALYPSALPSDDYSFRAFTYGYVQTQSFTAAANLGQTADVRINLIVGVNITVDLIFEHEHIVTPTNANMSARVRLFDDSEDLVAEWMSSEGVYLPANQYARAADGTNQTPFGNLQPDVPTPLALNTYNYVPGGITQLHVILAGLPVVPASGEQNGPYLYLTKGTFFTDPVTGYFAVGGFTSPGADWNAAGFRPNMGILGAPDYTGRWMVEVDFVNWYVSNASGLPEYFPPVSGLLLGESFHIVVGSSAKSGLSLTQDLATGSAGVDHSMAANHLGPYPQQPIWQISNINEGGEASGIYCVDLVDPTR